jgi:RNA recognition motif-containing protein
MQDDADTRDLAPVEYIKVEEAQSAISELNGVLLNDRPLVIRLDRKKRWKKPLSNKFNFDD